jgi:SAM-dependent methyltransferase
MQDLEGAYREWQRVLAPGGKLLVFDAGWYSYLADAEVNEQRLRDQEAGYPRDWAEDTLATSDEEKRCEDIAAQLQTSYLVRPAWDKVTLAKLGFDRVRVDHQAGNVLWTEEEQAFYRATPFFAVEAMK